MTINSKSFKDIYDTYFENICRFLNYYTRDIRVIEEVVQDIFVTLWEERYKSDIQHIKTYLYRSARNRILNYLRDEENRRALLENWSKDEYGKTLSADCIDRNEFDSLLQKAIDDLPPKCKQIYIMAKEENLSYKDIARINGVSVKTVDNQMGIALKKIRGYMTIYFGKGFKVIAFLLLISLQ